MKKKLAIGASIAAFLLLCMIVLVYRTHEARKAEVAENCRILLEQGSLGGTELAFLAKYQKIKIEHPWEGASEITIPPSRYRTYTIGQFTFVLHYWNEAKLDDTKATLPGWTIADIGYEFSLSRKGVDDAIIHISYLYSADTSNKCAIEFLHSP